MRLRPDVAQRHQIRTGYLVLDGEFIFFGVRKPISIVKGRRAADRPECVEKLGQIIVWRTACRMFG